MKHTVNEREIYKSIDEQFERSKSDILEHNNINIIATQLTQAVISNETLLAEWIITKYPEACSKTTMLLAAQFNRIHLVKLIHKHSHSTSCSCDAIVNAASMGHLEVIMWLNDNCILKTTSDALNIAALNGHLPVVKYLVEKRPQDGISTIAITNAVKSKYIEIARYLRQAFDKITSKQLGVRYTDEQRCEDDLFQYITADLKK